jgi:hypothetical protein
LQRFANTAPEHKISLGDTSSDWLMDDPRWQLVQRVLGSRHFARSPLLSKFLIFITTEALEGRGGGITEHQIGVQVFGRPAMYRTVEDNIVRNYARQLRKRLAEYFSNEGRSDEIRIEIPLGGYVPVFAVSAASSVAQEIDGGFSPVLAEVAGIDQRPLALPVLIEQTAWRRIWVVVSVLAIYSAALVCITWIAATHAQTSVSVAEPAQILWQTMLGGSNDTYVVPPDAGLNLLEDMSHHPLPLAEYMMGGYLSLPLPRLDTHTLADLRTQEFTSFGNLQIITALNHLSEYNSQRVLLRFPRDLRLDDLKNANAVIIGSVCSNPWASIGDGNVNFRIECNEGMNGATIVNLKPRLGEVASYESHWNEPTHITYALISFMPNLSGDGHLLFLQGLDAAGTQSAAEAVLHSNVLSPILMQAKHADGSLGAFEVLLRSTSIQSNATDTQIVASRIR